MISQSPRISEADKCHGSSKSRAERGADRQRDWLVLKVVCGRAQGAHGGRTGQRTLPAPPCMYHSWQSSTDFYVLIFKRELFVSTVQEHGEDYVRYCWKYHWFVLCNFSLK